MVWSIRVIGVLALLALLLVLSFRVSDKTDETAIRWRPLGTLIGVPLLIIGILMLGAIGQLQPGERGVVLNLGAMTGKILSPGPYIIQPFLESVEVMDVQEHKYEAKASAASHDLQDVSTVVAVNFALDPGRVGDIFQNLRRDYVDRVMQPAIQESVKATTALYNAEQLITERADVKRAIVDNLTARLATYGINVRTVSITDFSFSKVFTDAIEAKVAAAQDALKAENKLRQIEVEARQAKQSAEGRAQAAIAEANGQAAAILTVADAQAKANKLVNETLTDPIIRYQLVQKLGPDIRVIVLPSGQQFILGPDILGGN